MNSRYVMYLDFLGTSEATCKWDEGRQQQFTELLRAVEATQREQHYNSSGKKIEIAPEFTAFSDNIVISYPDKSLEHPPGGWVDIVLQDCLRTIKSVVAQALELGVLVRGGLAYGQCFHEKGVLFGKALVDAHKLECKHARNARILIQNTIINQLTINKPENIGILFHDVEDDQWHLNYFRSLMEANLKSASPSLEENEAWLKSKIEMIFKNIESLQGEEKKSEKWKWFYRHFSEAYKHFSIVREFNDSKQGWVE